jgi:hypothetical protein
VQVKYSHLDIVGRPVVVLEKPDVIPEHNLYFQVCHQIHFRVFVWINGSMKKGNLCFNCWSDQIIS